jgi:hypothetical protein
MTSRVRAVAGLITALVLAGLIIALAGSATGTPVVPPTRAERLALLQKDVDSSWADLHRQFPNAQRPKVETVQFLSGAAWAKAFATCGTQHGVRGIQVSAKGDITIAAAQASGTPVELALFACRSEYPSPHLMSYYLSDSQIGAIYAYDVGFLQPCLAESGVPISRPPSRERFIETFYINAWNPYFTQPTTQGLLRADGLLKRCPIWPHWVPFA